jgi:hypothetical protein
MSFQPADAHGHALALVQAGKNVWIDGPAGTGKTLFSQSLRRSDGSLTFLAPTGVAAVLSGGMTIHSFLGFGIAPFYDREVLEKKVRAMNPAVRKRLRAVQAIVVDEISMVRADLLDALDRALRAVSLRGRGTIPFGGRQLILIGDTGQLRPIVAEDEEKAIEQSYPNGHMFYDSRVFQDAGFQRVDFCENFRQANDRVFAEILNGIRGGCLSRQQLDLLNGRHGEGGEDAVTVVAYNAAVERINGGRLQALDGPAHTFTATRTGTFEERTAREIVPEVLELRVGTRVMLAVNRPPDCYNGKMGTVTGFCHREGTPCAFVRADDGREILVEPHSWKKMAYALNAKTGKLEEKTVGTYGQLPLRPAWAITVHRSQGLTFERMVIQDPTSFFPGEDGRRMLYVAYSRCPKLSGIRTNRRLQPNHLERYAIALGD